MTTSSSESAHPAHQADEIEIVERAYDHPDAVRLVRALYDEQVGRYGFADPVDADPAEYAPPRGLFLVAYVDGVPGACGGYRTYDPSTATVELKKLYTVPQLRGRGLGRLVGAELERHAADHGARRAILETGARSHAALALVRLAGYRPTARYVTGRDPAINRAFAKDLSNLNQSNLNRSPQQRDLRTIAQ
jgi:GNAT superfamily N-acetyltransferase